MKVADYEIYSSASSKYTKKNNRLIALTIVIKDATQNLKGKFFIPSFVTVHNRKRRTNEYVVVSKVSRLLYFLSAIIFTRTLLGGDDGLSKNLPTMPLVTFREGSRMISCVAGTWVVEN